MYPVTPHKGICAIKRISLFNSGFLDINKKITFYQLHHTPIKMRKKYSLKEDVFSLKEVTLRILRCDKKISLPGYFQAKQLSLHL